MRACSASRVSCSRCLLSACGARVSIVYPQVAGHRDARGQGLRRLPNVEGTWCATSGTRSRSFPLDHDRGAARVRVRYAMVYTDMRWKPFFRVNGHPSPAVTALRRGWPHICCCSGRAASSPTALFGLTLDIVGREASGRATIAFFHSRTNSSPTHFRAAIHVWSSGAKSGRWRLAGVPVGKLPLVRPGLGAASSRRHLHR